MRIWNNIHQVHVHSQTIGKQNNSKVFGSKKAEDPTHEVAGKLHLSQRNEP